MLLSGFLGMIKSSVNATKESKSIDSTKSSDMSKSSSDWKEPVTKSEKIFEHKKRKGK